MDGNLFLASFDRLGCLATPCWFVSVWERLSHYGFEVFLGYPTIPVPQSSDVLMVDVFLTANVSRHTFLHLNRCRLRLEMLWLSDIVTANGRQLDKQLL